MEIEPEPSEQKGSQADLEETISIKPTIFPTEPQSELEPSPTQEVFARAWVTKWLMKEHGWDEDHARRFLHDALSEFSEDIKWVERYFDLAGGEFIDEERGSSVTLPPFLGRSPQDN